MAKQPKRIKTGISGLDKVLGGGLLEGSNFIVEGTPGTGKTTLGMQFLINGAKKYGEPGIYLSTSQDINSIVQHFAKFNFGVPELAKDKKKILLAQFADAFYRKRASVTKTLQPKDLVEAINFFLDEKVHYKRLVIDSISTLVYNYEDPNEMRGELDRVFNFTTRKGLTTLFLTEESTCNDPFTFEDFLADGIIHLRDVEDKNCVLRRGVQVLKQRGSPVDRKLRPYKITPDGLKVDTEKEICLA